MKVVASAFDLLELNFRSIVELLSTAYRVFRMSTTNPEASGSSSPMPMGPGNH